MERIFTESIRKLDGSVKYMEGATRNFPPAVWGELADQIGKPLSDFSAEPADFLAMVKARAEAASAPPPAKTARPKLRRTE